MIPVELWDELQLDYDACKYLDGARIPIRKEVKYKHNYTAHPQYTREVRYEVRIS